MNLINIARLIETIQAPYRVLEMSAFVKIANLDGQTIPYRCGAPMCIAGHAAVLSLHDAKKPAALEKLLLDADNIAAEFLGLTVHQGRALFYMTDARREWRLKVSLAKAIGHGNPGLWSNSYFQATAEFDRLPASMRKEAAINVLQGMIDTGIVDWPKAIDKVAKY